MGNLFIQILSSLWHKATDVAVPTDQLGLVLILLVLHVVLAIATLAWGDQSVCELLAPIKKMFSLPGLDDVLQGAFDLVLALPRALVYCVYLYARAYLLAIRLVLGAMLAAALALLGVVVCMLLLLLLSGESSIPLTPSQVKALDYGIILWWIYCYWRLDGKRALFNLQRAFNCI